LPLSIIDPPCYTESSEGGEIATGNPLMDLLVAMQRGMLLAAGKMGEVRAPACLLHAGRRCRLAGVHAACLLACLLRYILL